MEPRAGPHSAALVRIDVGYRLCAAVLAHIEGVDPGLQDTREHETPAKGGLDPQLHIEGHPDRT
jgi:hypothetical protein